MSNTDTVIVDFAALDSAISKFKGTSGQITSLEARLRSNAAQLKAAWTSNASEEYQKKMTELAKNFMSASESLEKQVADLQKLCNKQRMAEIGAGRIAENIASFILN